MPMLLVIFVVLVLFLIGLGMAWTRAGIEPKKILAGQVPDFRCDSLWVDMHRARRGYGHRYASGALQMPSACRAKLKALVARSPGFREDRCDRDRQCWTHDDGAKQFTLLFSPSHVTFRYAEAR